MNWEVLVVGGGKIGRMVAVILQNAAEYNVTIADADDKMLEEVAALGIATRKVDVTSEAELLSALDSKKCRFECSTIFPNTCHCDGGEEIWRALFRPHRRC